MENEPFPFSDTPDSWPAEAYPLESLRKTVSTPGYFDAVHKLELPFGPLDKAKRFRQLHHKVNTRRRRKDLKQDQLMYELECLRHHIYFVDESQAELEIQLQYLEQDEPKTRPSAVSLRETHERLRNDHARLQEQAQKIVDLEESMHKAEARLRREEDHLAEYTEVLMRQAECADLWACDTPESSPEIQLSRSQSLSPDTIVGSPVLEPLDAVSARVEGANPEIHHKSSHEYESSPDVYDEDEYVASPAAGFGFPEFEPPSPLALGPPRLATPPYPLFSSSKRVSIVMEPDAPIAESHRGTVSDESDS